MSPVRQNITHWDPPTPWELSLAGTDCHSLPKMFEYL